MTATAAKIDYREIRKEDAKEAKFPAEISGEYRVYISEPAYARMKKHTDTTNEVELCGVLIGEVQRDPLGFFLKVDDVIEGEKATNAGAQVTFTHQTWDHINAIKDKEFPKKRIVGWYHTHPGFGVFLSGMDLFIQQSYFNHPFQIAIVVETKQNTEGCFAWVDGNSTPLTRYWVGNREIELAKGEPKPVDPYRHEGPPPPSGAAPALRDADYANDTRGMPSFLSLAFVGLLFFCGIMLGKMSAVGDMREREIGAMESEVYSLLEFASVNVAASKDFSDISDKIATAGSKVGTDPAAATKEIAQVQSDLKTLSELYAKKRSSFREGLNKLRDTKKTFNDRIEEEMHHQNQIDICVAELFVLRVQDMLNHEGVRGDPSKLTPHERDLARSMISSAIKLAPEVKNNIDPKLLDQIFSTELPVPKDEAPKEVPKKN